MSEVIPERVHRSFLKNVGDDVAYFAPMAVFLAFTWIATQCPGAFAWLYAIKTVIVGLMLYVLWGHYTKITWNKSWLGVIFGIIGLLQWVGMEKCILHVWPNYPRLSHEIFDPARHFSTEWGYWSFVAIRIAGASLVVPVMEELFWRDFLWRSIIAPNDFKLAAVGEWELKAFLVVALVFGAGVHIEWMTAISWGLLVGALLIWTRSLGACIIMHAVTNFLLGIYVLMSHDWRFW